MDYRRDIYWSAALARIFLVYECRESGDNLFFVDVEGGNPSIWKSNGTLSVVEKVLDNTSFPQRLYAYDGGFFFDGGGIQYFNGTPDDYVTIFTEARLNAATVYNGLFYGVGCDANHCFLFKSDGTPEGTETVINLGGSQSETVMYGEIPVLNNKMILGGSDGTHGVELMVSDGTAPGTQLLKDVYPGGEGSMPSIFSLHGDKVLFQADNGVHGRETWISDGTPEGTMLLKDVSTGTEPAISSSPFFAVDNHLYFLASADKYVPKDLWRSDGTPDATGQYFDFTDYPAYIGEVGESLIFMTDKKIVRVGLSNAGSSLLADFSTDVGAASYSMGVSTPALLFGDDLVFTMFLSGPNISSGYELWKTDGTPSGTKMIKDIWPGSGSGAINCKPAVLEDNFIFAAHDGTSGTELWISDGTEEGTRLLKEIVPGVNGGLNALSPATFVTFNGAVYFPANDGNGGSLWKTNGTAEGTAKVKEGVPGPSTLVVLNDKLIFTAYDNEQGWSIWRSDGTDQGTYLVADLGLTVDVGYQPFSSVAGNGLVYIAANDGTHGTELWITDGTASGTRMLDIAPGIADSNPGNFTVLNEYVYFNAAGKIWRTKGDLETTEVIADIEAHSDLILLGSALYFVGISDTYRAELVRVDIDAVLANEEDLSVEVAIFPNPSSDKIVIKAMLDEPAIVNILDTSGRRITSFSLASQVPMEHDLSAYNPGIYIASIQTRKGRIVKRFVKTKDSGRR